MKQARSIFVYGLMAMIIMTLTFHSAYADLCVMQGNIFYHNGSAVLAGTPVTITNLNTAQVKNSVTGGGNGNFYLDTLTCTQGTDVLNIFSGYMYWNASLDVSSVLGKLNYYNNMTYGNFIPIFTSALPNKVMDEDNATGIDNATDLDSYTVDYDGTPLIYSIFSQSNSALASASLDGTYIDISAPAADQSGSSNVCVRAYDGEDYSSPSCFTITVNSVPDRPVFSSAADNVTGIVKGGVGIRITTTASDVDGDLVRLYVCNTPNVNSGGCINTQRCTDFRASNPYCTFTAESDVNEHSWYAFVYDATGLISASNYTENYTTDGSDPATGTVVIEGGASYLTDTTMDMTWSGFSDTGSGIRYYYYSFADNSGTTTGTRVSNTTFAGQLTGASQGSNTVYVWAQDWAGNIGSAASDSIIVDTANPVLSGWTQSPSGLQENTTGDFTVTVSVTDTTWNGSAPPRIRYQYDSGGYYAWQDMTALGGNTYSYSISEPVGGWVDYVGESLFYQVSVTDSVGHTTTETKSEYIDLFNYAPVLESIPNQVIAEGSNLSITLEAEDHDGDTLYFSSDYNFTFDRISANRTIAWWVPSGTFAGSNSVTFSVTDNIDTDSQVVTIDVTSENDPPVLEHVGNIYGYLHIPFLKYIYGWDPDNRNNYTLDNNLLIFDKVEAYSWFRIHTYFNVSNQSYYGVINFTPLLSQEGHHNITLYVSDGTAIDRENITFTVGYCGDKDSGGDPWCDEDYESCSTCPEDCGKCNQGEDKYMTVIIDPRNCLNRNFTIWTYKLYDRATCDTEGLIVGGKEVCGNLSSVKVDVMILKSKEWQKVDNYVSDSNGEITFLASEVGEYKLTATKSGYPNAYEYLEIGPCIVDEKTVKTAVNKTEVKPSEEKPSAVKEPQTQPEGEEVPQATTTAIIMYYVIVPVLAIILIVLGYYYYDRQKNNVVWILRARIWTRKNYIKAENGARKQWKKLMAYLGYDK